SIGDFNGIKNIGNIELTNDTAITQVSQIQLNDTIVGALVDSYQAANTTTHLERLTIRAIDNFNVANATVGVSIDAGALTAQSSLDVTLGRGANFLSLGAGADRVVLLGNYVAGTYNVTENGVALNTEATATGVARIVTDTINLGAGNDTLVTYGALNLTGATLSGIEAIQANSALVITASEYAGLVAARAALSLSTPVITFSGSMVHQLTIVDDIVGANNIDLSLISVTGGSLIFDVINQSNATGGGVNNTTTSNAVIVSGGASASAGTVGLTPTNGGTAALTSPNTLTNGVDLFNNATAGLLNANFGGIAYANPTLNAATTLTTTQANLAAGDVIAFGTATTDTLAFSGAVTNLTVLTGSSINGVTVGGVEVLQLDNAINSVIVTSQSVAGLTIVGGTASDVVNVTAVAAATNINTGDGNDNVTIAGSAATAAAVFNLGNGNDTFTITGAATSATNLNGGAGTDTIVFATAGLITDANFTLVSNVEVASVNNTAADNDAPDTLAAIAGIRTLLLQNNAATTVTPTASYNAIVAANPASNVFTINANTFTGTTLLTLGAAVTGNVAVLETSGGYFTAAGSTANVDWTGAAGVATQSAIGGNGTNTFRLGTGLEATDVITGGTGADTVIVTGTGTGSAGITAVETIQFNATTAGQTLNTGAIGTGLTSITAAGSTVGVTINSSLLTLTTTTITGSGFADTITSANVAQTINGGAGIDAITLGTGSQTVVLANAAANADTITGFLVGTDKLQVSKALFAGLTSVVGNGFSVAAEFVSNATGAAVGTNAQFDYNTATGVLSYDADGTGAGAAVTVATLTGLPAIVATDIVIVA
ncbi:beta strand repeat-containing protein, partial [Undibacterium sp. Ji50W]|uniref:beta strand repeat-containing protein n=1 Tax=Undibacterium sp. Ji50W TaxID=3413041 RepID=UPI003BF2A0E0